ncbi:MAG: hypothetical protein OXC12_09240 [Spirochaetaceae bacterium]|nr:hypothetical protein [Spirochaetaceae bacterium]
MPHDLLSRDAASSAVADLVRALHATPQRAVIEVAGAGTLAVSWLHAVGGSSRTVLEATDRYCHASLASLLGATPAHAVTGAVAAAMAEAALRRACLLAGEETPVIGAACTAALASDRPRRGADRAFVAVAGALGTAVSDLAFPAEGAAAAVAEGGGLQTRRAAARQQQEDAVSTVLVAELSRACGVDAAQVSGHFAGPPALEVYREFQPSEPFAALQSGLCGSVLLNAAAQVDTAPVDWRGKALLSGAYHPLHHGHLALGAAAATFLDREVVYELPLVNADKAPISARDAQQRSAQFAGRAPVVLSRAPLFSDKAVLFPGAVFVVGADTAERLVDQRFYGGSADSMDAALATLAERGCGLLVAGRRTAGRYLTLSDLVPSIPAARRGLFQELPEALFRSDISSTELRSRRAAAASPACH